MLFILCSLENFKNILFEETLLKVLIDDFHRRTLTGSVLKCKLLEKKDKEISDLGKLSFLQFIAMKTDLVNSFFNPYVKQNIHLDLY